MEVVLDSNILFRILISGGEIIDLLYDESLKIYAPLKLKEELEKHKAEIIEKTHFSEQDVKNMILILAGLIEFVSREEYSEHINKAKKLLKGHDKDIDFVALALKKQCKVWAYEKRLFEIGMGISTKEIDNVLKKEEIKKFHNNHNK